MSDEELKTAGPDFLEPALISRAQRGPIRWDMEVYIGKASDPGDNPTLAGPDTRSKLKVGTLSIKKAMAQKRSGARTHQLRPNGHGRRYRPDQ